MLAEPGGVYGHGRPRQRARCQRGACADDVLRLAAVLRAVRSVREGLVRGTPDEVKALYTLYMQRAVVAGRENRTNIASALDATMVTYPLELALGLGPAGLPRLAL